MSPKVKQSNTVAMLAKHELAIGRLYKAYAEKFPDYEAFWRELSEDETDHAKCLLKLGSKVEEGAVYLNENRFQMPAITRSLRYIEQMKREALKQDFSLVHALSVAASLEEALIDNKFFEVFEGDSPQLREVLRRLAEATEQHRRRVLDARDGTQA